MSIKTAINCGVKAAGRKLASASPTIMVVSGAIGLVAAGVIACKKTAKELDHVLEEHKTNVQALKDIRDGVVELDDISTEEYAETKYKSHLAHVYLRTADKLIKVYGPALLLALLSVLSILGGHKILTKRHLAAIAECYAVKETLNEYRKRVRNKVGEETEKLIYLNADKEIVTDKTVDENGNEKVNSHEALVGERTNNSDSYIFSEKTVKSYMWDKRDADLRKQLAIIISEANRAFTEREHLAMTKYEVMRTLGFTEEYMSKHPEILTDGWMMNNPLAGPLDGICPIEMDVKLISGTGDDRVYEITFNSQGNVQEAMRVANRQKKSKRRAERKANRKAARRARGYVAA